MFTYLLCKDRLLKMMDILRFVLNKINTSKQHVVVLIFLFFHEQTINVNSILSFEWKLDLDAHMFLQIEIDSNI